MFTAGRRGRPSSRAILKPVAPRWGDVSLTLAFELAALRRLADPEAAVSDARAWSENVGVVTDRPPHVLTKFTRDHHVRNGFEPASEPAAETLAHLLAHFETDRFVFVVAEADAAPDGWERQAVADAAAEAGWTLAPEDTETDQPGESGGTGRQRDDWP